MLFRSGPDRRRGDDRQPIDERVKFFRRDLHEDRGNKNDAENCRPDQIAGASGRMGRVLLAAAGQDVGVKVTAAL